MKDDEIMTREEWIRLSVESRAKINVYGLEHERLQTHLKLATDLINALTNNGLLSPRLMTPETRGLWERWIEEMRK